MIYKFYDTCSLLLNYNNLFEEEGVRIAISSITLQELEEIKSSFRKDAEIKFSARKLLHVLEDNRYKYDLLVYKPAMLAKLFETHVFEETNDMKILACAYFYDTYVHPDETVFVTNDLALQTIANLYFGEDSITSVKLG
jgi:predicted ribonuclease YlaK